MLKKYKGSARNIEKNCAAMIAITQSTWPYELCMPSRENIIRRMM